MTKPKRPTAMTLSDVVRSAADALLPPQADPPAASPDAGSEPSPPAAASAPAGEPLAPVADVATAPTTPPPQATPQPEEHPMTATSAPAAPPAPTTASVTVTPDQPTPTLAAPAVATRSRRWLFNPANDNLHAFEVQPDGQVESGFDLLLSQRGELIEMPEAFARAVLEGGPRPMLPPRAVPGLPAGLAQSNDLAGQSKIG